MLDNTQSIICAFGLAAAAPRSPYRHLELCGIALVILYKLDQKSVCQLTIKDIPELKRAAGSKTYEDENEIR